MINRNLLSLDSGQLNRLFPFFVIVDADMNIVELGNNLEEIIGNYIGEPISDHFEDLHIGEDDQYPDLGNTGMTMKKQPLKIIGRWEKIFDQNLFFFAGSGQSTLDKGMPAKGSFELDGNKDPQIESFPFSVNERSYHNVIANMKLGLLELDMKEQIVYANNSFCEISGYDFEDIKGRSVSELFNGKLFSSEGDAINYESITSELSEIQYLDAKGERKWWLVCRTINFNDKSEVIGSLLVNFEITRNKGQELELNAAKLKAEKAANSKDMFLANMSHEIRTPMNAIITMVNQLSRTNLTVEQDYCIQTIQTASKNLMVIIDDILDLSKIEAGKVNLEYIGLNISKVLREVIQVIIHRAEKKGLVIHYLQPDYDDIIPVLIGDPFRISQVVLNLLSNAIKFTDKGSVSLTLSLLADFDDAQEIEVLVKDTGIGMEPEFIKLLFDNFSQEYESVSRRYGGTGLGMSISKKLVSQMGGYFNVKSEKGRGSSISFVIRLKKGIDTDLPVEPKLVLSDDLFSGKRILIVDDNEMNRLVASTILLNFGPQIMVAESGEVALEMVDKEDFDLILMDIQMPVLNGYDTTRLLRDGGYKGPIIALTASAISGEREKCIAAGMDDYITKPINEELFVKVIDKWMVKKTVTPDHPEAALPLYNLDGLYVISKGREDFVTKMIQLFCDQMPIALNDLNNALENTELQTISKQAHKLKSTIDHLGIISIQRVIRDIESLSDENAPVSELIPMIDQVNHVINRVILDLQTEIKRRNQD
ncbi:ATP-binding protein [Pedobacter sp. WC2501]|uniref:ATP-binding protein n=1 Tax=Pedobacter sp. WC2501 TaxID=3461400 RepID=UPI0040465A38